MHRMVDTVAGTMVDMMVGVAVNMVAGTAVGMVVGIMAGTAVGMVVGMAEGMAVGRHVMDIARNPRFPEEAVRLDRNVPIFYYITRDDEICEVFLLCGERVYVALKILCRYPLLL